MTLPAVSRIDVEWLANSKIHEIPLQYMQGKLKAAIMAIDS